MECNPKYREDIEEYHAFQVDLNDNLVMMNMHIVTSDVNDALVHRECGKHGIDYRGVEGYNVNVSRLFSGAIEFNGL